MAGYVNLATYLSQLKVVPPEPSFEPELDDKDGKKDREMRFDTSSIWLSQPGCPSQTCSSCSGAGRQRIWPVAAS